MLVSFVLQKNPSHKSVLTCFQMISPSVVFACFEIKRQIQLMLRVGVLPHSTTLVKHDQEYLSNTEGKLKAT